MITSHAKTKSSVIVNYINDNELSLVSSFWCLAHIHTNISTAQQIDVQSSGHVKVLWQINKSASLVKNLQNQPSNL